MTSRFSETIPNGQLEVVKLNDSNHTDQGDSCVTDEFLNSCIQKFAFKTSFTKKEGSNPEFYECITMMWLKFLHQIDFHDDTFEYKIVLDRSMQFSSDAEYLHRFKKDS